MILKKFEDCQFVDGFKRAIISDLTRCSYEAIPKSLNIFMTNFDNCEREQIIEICKNQNEVVEEYLDFLINNEYCFYIDEFFKNSFPPITLNWDSPFLITNTIIELGFDFNPHKIKFILTWTSCQNVEIRIQEVGLANLLEEILMELENSLVNSISLVFPFCEFNSIIGLNLHKYLKVNSLLCYDFNSSSYSLESFKDNNPMVIFYENNFENIVIIKEIKSFRININLFTESQTHHTYFNRKMYIGAKGEIKNAPECEEEFGNIKDLGSVEDLTQIIATPEFQKYWFVHKELCDVCKDCEFRHMCVDNRLPYQRKGGSWYHKTECNYNPYICKWKDEESYKSLEECGVVSNENGFSINHEKVTAINKTLLEEKTVNA